MGLFENNFPYTNFHELNIDWLLQKVKELSEFIENIDSLLKMNLPVWRGEYDISEDYEPLSIVVYNGEYYIALDNVESGITPDSTRYWLKLNPEGWSEFSQFKYLNFLCPDFYSGSDSEKIEKLFDYINQNPVNSSYVVVINRMYTVDKTVSVPKINSNYGQLVLVGNGYNSGFNLGTLGGFTGNADAVGNPAQSGGVFFKNLSFIGAYSDTPLFNADSLIRVACDTCNFTNVKYIVMSSSARGYIQDFIFEKCQFRGGKQTVFKGTVGCYSGYMRGCRLYDTVIMDINGGTGSEKFTVEDCDIEGYATSVVKFTNVAVRALTISRNYFETSAVTETLNLQGVTNGSITVNSNYVHHNRYDSTADKAFIVYDPQYNPALIVQNNSLAGKCFLLTTVGTARKCTGIVLAPNHYNDRAKQYITDALNSIPLDNWKAPVYRGDKITMYLPLGTVGILSMPIGAGSNIPNSVTTGVKMTAYYKSDGSYVSGDVACTIAVNGNVPRVSITGWTEDMRNGMGVFEISYTF